MAGRSVPRLALPLAYFVWSVTTVTLLATLTPPWQNPDEAAQMQRAVQVALGGLVGTRTAAGAGGLTDPAVAQAEAPLLGLRFHPEAKVSGAMLAGSRAVRWGRPAEGYFPNTALYPPLLYAPAVLAVWIGRATRLHVDATLDLARLLCGLTAAAIGMAAVAVAVRLRVALLAILVLPMTVALAASPSQDALLIPLACLAAAALDRARACASATGRMETVLVASLALIATARPSHLPLALLPLCLPSPRRRADLLAAGLILLAGLLWNGWVGARVSVPLFVADPPRQLALMLHDPLLFPRAMARSLGLWWQDYAGAAIGRLGWLDTALPAPFYRAATATVILALLSAAAPDDRPARWARPLAAGCALAGLLLTFLALYVGWSPPGGATVLGMQGRYALPLLPVLAFALPSLGRWATRLRTPALAAVVGLAALVPAVTAAALARRYLLVP